MKLPQDQIDFLRLVLRSPDAGEGWRPVGKMLLPMVTQYAAKERLAELVEVVPADDGTGKIRLTERGAVAVAYM
jgi:hypothetical protein